MKSVPLVRTQNFESWNLSSRVLPPRLKKKCTVFSFIVLLLSCASPPLDPLTRCFASSTQVIAQWGEPNDGAFEASVLFWGLFGLCVRAHAAGTTSPSLQNLQMQSATQTFRLRPEKRKTTEPLIGKIKASGCFLLSDMPAPFLLHRGGPSSILTSFFFFFAFCFLSAWDELQDGKMNETLKRYWERAGMQMLRLPRALAATGRRGREGPQNRYYSPPVPRPSFQTSLSPSLSPPSLHLQLIHCAVTHPASPLPLLTVESPKWQRIKHLGTEAPRVLISASLAWKAITSRREWVLDEWRSSANEMKISFLSNVGSFSPFFWKKNKNKEKQRSRNQ